MKRKETIEEIIPPERPSAVLVIKTAGRTIYASFEKNEAADALLKKLSRIVVRTEKCGDGFVGALPWELPLCDEQICVKTGDILLCQGNRIAICTRGREGRFTRLARIGNVDEKTLAELFDGADAELSPEWGE